MIELNQVTKRYRAGDIETTALDTIDMQIEAGEYVAITGPSGCGKSTLLGLLGLLDAPTSGSYKLQGEETADKTPRELAAIRRNRIGFVFQSFNLVDDLTVRDNVQLALRYGELPEKAQRARVAEVLERLGMAHRAAHHPSQLSGGQQQRVAIARAIAARPALLLADEPTGNLDPALAQEIMGLFALLGQSGVTVLVASHDLHLIQRMKKRVLVLEHGRLIDDFRPNSS